MKKLTYLVANTLLLIFLTGSLQVIQAQQDTTHEVQSGETLYGIASQYDITVQEIRDWNDLDSDNLSEGQVLIVAREEGEQEDDQIVHVVEPGESLFSISKEYGVSISELESWNDLNEKTLSAEQELVIYPSESDNSEEEQESVSVENRTQNNTYYTVKSGDTLYEIAQNHGMTVEELRELNDLESDNLSIGQKLTVRGSSTPPSVSDSSTESTPQGKFIAYRLQENTDLENLLEEFHMDEQEFRLLNPDNDDSTFRRGQQVTVLAPPTRKRENPYRASSNSNNLGEVNAARYDSSEQGNTTTSGELYNSEALTAAHSNMAIGTVIYVQNPANGRGIFVRINDRTSNGGLKLSEAAWNTLNLDDSNAVVTISQDQ